MCTAFRRCSTGWSAARALCRRLSGWVTDSNLGARTVNPAVPAYVSEALDLGLQLEPARRIQTVPQLGRALSSPQAAEEEARTLYAAGRRLQREKKPALSLTAILTGILILLAVLTC